MKRTKMRFEELYFGWTESRLSQRGRFLFPGMMLHQDGRNHEWVPGKRWGLIVTMDDTTNEHYSMFFLEALFLAFTNNGFLYAVIRTLTAIRTFAGINHILVLAFTDGPRRADVLTVSTRNTSIRNFMRHIVPLLRFLVFWTLDCAPSSLYAMHNHYCPSVFSLNT